MQAWLRLGEVAREGPAVGVGVADVGARVDVLDSRSMSAISWLSSDPMSWFGIRNSLQTHVQD